MTENKKLIQDWIGYIEEILPDGFRAKLYDLTNEGNVDHAKIPNTMLNECDISLLKIGGTISWKLFKTIDDEFISEIKLIQPNDLTEDEISQICDEAKEISDYFMRT